jgi:hypothetical protein
MLKIRDEHVEASGITNCSGGKWDVDCILDIFCKGDRQDMEVVKKLPRLTIHKREPKQVHYKKFEGGKWVDGGFTSGGSARGTTVWINEGTDCCDAASTLFHEVAHTDQPASMAGSQREYDAYFKTEEWRIKKGLPPHHSSFRKKVSGKEVPDMTKIKKYVDKAYAYNPPTPIGGGPPPPRVMGLASNGKDVRLSDGTTRAPKEGDAYRLPDTGGKIVETIDPKEWKCP